VRVCVCVCVCVFVCDCDGAFSAGTVTNSTMLTFAVNIKSSSLSFGLPLYVLVLEDATSLGVLPVPTDCTSRLLCGGRRFYSFCYNGGTNRIHCDETIDRKSCT
jgi:hypothetical protein